MIIVLITMFQLLTIDLVDRIEIIIPTVEQETEYVWRTIHDINFFKQHNYQVALPQGTLIENLKDKASRNDLNDSDYQSLLAFMRSKVYKKSDYQNGFYKIKENISLINKMINEIGQLETHWEYKEFETYEVKLTLYGPGGSYDPENGSILIYTTIDGQFKQYENPSNTIIHEIIHIGTEQSIMAKNQVSHPLKERIIDKIVMMNFSHYLPDYKLQGFGDARIDEFLKDKEDLKNLNEIVSDFQEKFYRK